MIRSSNSIKFAAGLAGMMLLSGGSLVRGDVISLYEFGASGNIADADNYASTDGDANSTAGNLVRGSGYGTGLTANWPNPTSATFYSAPNWVLRRKSQPTYFEPTGDDGNYLNDYARAYAGGTNYLEWTIIPQAGYQLSLDSFSINVTTSNSRFFYYYLSSNIDGYDAVIGAVGGVTSSGTPVVSLTGSQFQNLTTPVTFRLWTWGNQSGSSGSA